MKAYQELNLKLKEVSDSEFIDIIINFTQQVKNWTYLEKESKKHIEETGNPSCILFLDDDHHKPNFLITKRKDQFYYIGNIFNSQHGYIPMLEYNALLRHFYQDFKGFIDSNIHKISIEISKEDIGLQEIISSPKAREFFEKYLIFLPLSYHPNDIERLDSFICAASRFCKKSIDIEYLKRYLIEDLNWTKDDAKWCCNRIEIGLAILKVHKKF
ncbi:MAG: hypothetical protein HEQ25_07855 [Dolichospermum sp. DET73]|jgi:hypothetical protein|nr:hypothetical protein [Dolichospermum sp. DET73]